MTSIEKITNETINKGGVLALMYFDLHSKDQEQLKQLATGFVDGILKQDGVVSAYGEIEEPLESEGVFSTSIEVKVLTKDFLSLITLCSVFNPITVEIMRPNEIRIPLDKAHELLMSIGTNWFNIKKYLAEKVSSKEELEGFKKYVQNRLEVGKRLLEKKGE